MYRLATALGIKLPVMLQIMLVCGSTVGTTRSATRNNILEVDFGMSNAILLLDIALGGKIKEESRDAG